MTREQAGNFIRQKRIEKELTQKQLADISGASYQRVLEVEKSKKNYAVDLLFSFLDGLQYDIIFVPRGSVGITNVKFKFTNILPAKEDDTNNDIFKNLNQLK